MVLLRLLMNICMWCCILYHVEVRKNRQGNGIFWFQYIAEHCLFLKLKVLLHFSCAQDFLFVTSFFYRQALSVAKVLSFW